MALFPFFTFVIHRISSFKCPGVYLILGHLGEAFIGRRRLLKKSK